MNEQIRECWIKAAREDAGETWDSQEQFIERFAELMIKECVGVIEGGRFLHDQAPTAIFARECSSAIKRHFGVE